MSLSTLWNENVSSLRVRLASLVALSHGAQQRAQQATGTQKHKLTYREMGQQRNAIRTGQILWK